ncbi:MAG: hypothetical protein ACLFRT_13125 [Actinomycetota bacterium]
MDRRYPTDALRRHAIRTEEAFSDRTPDIVAQVMEGRPSISSALASRFAKVAAALLFTALGIGGLGVAADASVPGQLLYPVDQSIERILANVGLSTPDQRLTERTDEARVLINLDQHDKAATTLLTAVRSEYPRLSPENAGEHRGAILEAVVRLLSAGDATNSDEGLSGPLVEIAESLGVSIGDSSENSGLDRLVDGLLGDH